MKRLLEQSNHIIELLEQIQRITLNQQTIILQKDRSTDEMNMIEEMSSYKNSLMIEVEAIEQEFEKKFKIEKEKISEHNQIKQLKDNVVYILKLKEEIILGEQKNLLLFEDQFKKQIEKIDFKKNPQEVARAYEQQKKNK